MTALQDTDSEIFSSQESEDSAVATDMSSGDTASSETPSAEESTTSTAHESELTEADLPDIEAVHGSASLPSILEMNTPASDSPLVESSSDISLALRHNNGSMNVLLESQGYPPLGEDGDPVEVDLTDTCQAHEDVLQDQPLDLLYRDQRWTADHDKYVGSHPPTIPEEEVEEVVCVQNKKNLQWSTEYMWESPIPTPQYIHNNMIVKEQSDDVEYPVRRLCNSPTITEIDDEDPANWDPKIPVMHPSEASHQITSVKEEDGEDEETCGRDAEEEDELHRAGELFKRHVIQAQKRGGQIVENFKKDCRKWLHKSSAKHIKKTYIS